MSLPIISKDDIESNFNNFQVVGNAMKGGQKLVFPCEISGTKYALKLILLSDGSDKTDDDKEALIDAVQARVNREVTIMREVDTPYVVKLGEGDLIRKIINGQDILLYAEEWIEGYSVDSLIKSQRLSLDECLHLCVNIAMAIEALWNISIVHRDIKPQNIIRRSSSGEYVLLDMGFAFDLEDKSLTAFGMIPGTKIYFSPEQLDYMHKRDIDFRSDLFSLGIVLYQAVTGIHPFYTLGMTDQELYYRIVNQPIIAPTTVNNEIPIEMSNIICRLLNKQPSGRYRKIEMLLSDVKSLNQ